MLRRKRRKKDIVRSKTLNRIRTERMKENRLSHYQSMPQIMEERKIIDYKKRAKRNRRRRKMLLFLFIISILLCFVYFAPFFDIARIEVSGANRLTQDEVIYASGINMGKNIFVLNIGNAKKQVEGLPYVKTAKVQRGFPNIIKIIIEECKPFGYIKYNQDEFIIIDINGKMLEISNNLPQEHLIEIIAPINENPVLGQAFSDENSNFLKKYLATAEEIVHNDIRESVSLIDVSRDFELNMVYKQLKINFGDIQQLNYKFTSLKAILKEIGENAKGKLDLSVPGKYYYKDTAN
jgi:cell division protein FtsQ